jgi:glycosyltransferase involved in cell wall biosynthesis
LQEGFKKSDIEILVSTMNRGTLDFLVPMFPFTHFSGFSILVVNQTVHDNILESPYPNIRVINTFDLGLSKSRNLALDNALGKLCIIADDDVIFANNFEDKVINAFNDNNDAALISFRVKTPGGKLFKKYPDRRKVELNRLDMFTIMSIEMVLNRELVNKVNVRFNENFGIGAKFSMGEEALFVYALKDRGQKIVKEPEVLVIHPEVSTTTRITIKEKYYIQGAVCTAIFKNGYFKWVLLKLLFDIKQQKIKLQQVNTAVRSAILGRKDLIKANENNS